MYDPFFDNDKVDLEDTEYIKEKCKHIIKNLKKFENAICSHWSIHQTQVLKEITINKLQIEISNCREINDAVILDIII